MTPEMLIEKMFDESPCCTLDNCRDMLRVVLKSIDDGAAVDYVQYKISGDFDKVILKPDFKKFLDGEMKTNNSNCNCIRCEDTEIRGLVYGVDGNQFTCTKKYFTNLQECPCGFGDSRTEAFHDLMRQLEEGK